MLIYQICIVSFCSRCSSPVESPYSYPITPAMEQVIRRREELRQQEACSSCSESDSFSNDVGSSSDEEEDFVRATRSRVRNRKLQKVSTKLIRTKAKIIPGVVRMTSGSSGELWVSLWSLSLQKCIQCLCFSVMCFWIKCLAYPRVQGLKIFFKTCLATNTHTLTHYHKKLSLLILAHTGLHTAIRQVAFLDPNFLLTK